MNVQRMILTAVTALVIMSVTAFAGGQGIANVQIIHNAADPAAEFVDIYVNGEKALPDFEFRTATPFLELPAGEPIEVGVAPAGSGSVEDVLATFELNLRKNRNYVAIANGVLDPSQFDAGVNGDEIGFTVFTKKNVRTSAWWQSRVSVMAFHGATDAPKVDIKIRDRKWRPLFNNLEYGEFSYYRNIKAEPYVLEVTPGNDNQTVVAAFEADLSGLGGGAAVVFASGFLNPDNNQGGAPFGLFAALPSGDAVEFPAAEIPQEFAKLQIIHNAADPAAELVDIWVNGEKFLPDFAFRTATPFVDIPAGIDVNVGIAPAGSETTDDIIATFTINLMKDRNYVAIANGVLGGGFAENPDGESIAFTLFTKENVRTEGIWRHAVSLLGFHGATDAPTVDIVKNKGRWFRTLFNDLSYGEFSGYRHLRPKMYEVSVRPSSDAGTVVAKYNVDLTGLGGGAAVVFASGFLTPESNNDGAAFGLFAALPNGDVIEFPLVAPPALANLQVVHNAADPGVNMVDVYVNGERALDNFEFRTATPYLPVPAGVELNIGVAPKTSHSVHDTIANFTVVLEPDVNYVAFANGVVGDGFEMNPDGREIAFTILTKGNTRMMAETPGNVEFFVLHGSTDAPIVDVIARDVATLVDDAAYGDLTDYISVPPAEYILDVTPGMDNETIVASFTADLSALGGGSAAVFASGFLSPGNDNDGPGFGIFAALGDGTVVEFPLFVEEEEPMAYLQVIHNAADEDAALVDVYVNGGQALNDFAFRTASPFIPLPAGVELNVGIAGSGSGSADDTLADFTVTLEEDVRYVAIANGVLDDDYEANPDGRDIAFTLFTAGNLREAAQTSGNVEFIVLHGATDAPTVDVIARDVATIVDNAAYGDITDYISVPAADYTLDVTPGDDNGTIVASFSAPLAGLANGTAVVFASGFLTPDNEDADDAPGFGIFAALGDGTVVEFMPTDAEAKTQAAASLSNNLPNEFRLDQNYPNPFNPTTTITFALPAASQVTLSVYNVLGQEVSTLLNTSLPAGEHQVEFDASSVASGVYFYRISAENYSDTRKMMLVK
ncbi:DUF4397 domain-containing protein [candidate division GN15 bacterium]|nr:DUF4397 domain-containing protein [candidate division GN15 bacterium]